MAVYSGTGMKRTAKNEQKLVASSSPPRSHWNFGCADAKPARPRGASATAITTACTV